VILARDLPVLIKVPSGAAMLDLGEQLSGLLTAGDLVIATGDLGAGKTTLAQGIGRGLGSDGPVISPTFVISRVHRSLIGRPDLVHVDAYRLSSHEEIHDLDLDASIDRAITIVEWGEGLAEPLNDHRLEVDIRTDPGPYVDQPIADPVLGSASTGRTVLVRAVGDRWRDVDLTILRGFRDA
jgi:tRNA threonylcarbamoyladenosine biosynthesis protein TsaE